MIRNDEPLDTTLYYQPSEELTFFETGGLLFLDERMGDDDDEDTDEVDVESYWSNGWDDGPDPDDARDRMIEEDRWNGVD